MSREDEPSKTKMAHMTKLFAWKIPVVKETEKIAVIHSPSVYGTLS